MYDVICFGSATRDIFIDTGLKEINRKIAYPAGAKIPIKNLTLEFGGGGINVAMGTSKMGVKTAYLGKLGNDETARAILDTLKKSNIDFIGKQANGITGYGFILDSYEKNRTILTYHGLIDSFKFSEINKNKINAKWIFFSSLRGNSIKTEEKLVYWAKKRGIKIAFNLDARVAYGKKINLKKLLKNLDLIILNKEEAGYLVKGGNIKTLAEEIYNLGPKIIVITDEKKPACAFDGKKVYLIIPHNIKVVERTGAGDAFTSGFLASYIKTQDIEKSLKIALANSESEIQYLGAHNKLLTWNEANKR